jgi:hypothetical protein
MNKTNLKEGIFLKHKFFMLGGRLLKTLIPKQHDPFWNVVRLDDG